MAFLERGYSATTIKDIAERAGVSQETIYKGFGSKANLLKPRTTSPWQATTTKRPSPADPRAARPSRPPPRSLPQQPMPTSRNS